MRVELEKFVKSYKGLRALDEISIIFEPGQIVALLGQNGVGKTTMLRCLAGTVAVAKGEVLYDTEKFTRKRIDLRRRFSFLPDFPAVFAGMVPLAPYRDGYSTVWQSR
jgi:ribose transport system ATP-binding protein